MLISLFKLKLLSKIFLNIFILYREFMETMINVSPRVSSSKSGDSPDEITARIAKEIE